MGMSPRFAGLALFLCVATGFSQTYPTHYALILQDSPVGQRFATREAVRTPQADSYRRQIRSTQDAVRREAVARKLHVWDSVDTLLNAVFIEATPDQLNDARSIPGVVAVVPMRVGKADMNRANQLLNSHAAWTALGGQANAGQGVKVGIIDSGIDQTHPAFADAGYTAPAGFPKCSGFTDPCSNWTNKKVIVSRSYVSASSGTNPASSRPDDFSPRDRDGHGTAVASVIAGNSVTGTVSFSGVAPKAYLGSYKIYGSPYVNDYFTEDTLIKAIEDAVNDGMDVVNFSSHLVPISGPLDTGVACGLTGSAPCDPVATAFENAAQKVTIVVSAGNNGEDGMNYPTFNSIGSPANAPSVIAVGATTNSHFFNQSVSVKDAGAPSNLKGMLALIGDDPYAPVGALSAPVIDVSTVGDVYGCSPAPPADSLTGAFALISRNPPGSNCFFSDKVSNAIDAGAVGVIFYNYDSSTPPFPGNLSGFGVPVGMLSNANGLALKDYVSSHPGAVATIDPSGIEEDDPADANLFLGFSSTGPNLGDASMKPEIVAVGESMYMAAETYDPLGGQYSVTGFASAGGTSFSSPLVAGAAALVKQKHPTWTPSQIRSALIDTANQDATQDDSGETISIQYQGGGKVDAGAAVNATVLANPATVSFGVLSSDPSALSKQIAVTNTGTSAVNLTVAVTPEKTSAHANLTAGITPALDKTTLALQPGASGTVAISLTGTKPAAGFYSGFVTFQATGVSLHVPYQYLVGTGTPANLIPLDGNVDGIVGQPIYNVFYPRHPGSVAVKITDANGVPVAGAPVAWTASPRNSVTFQNPEATTNNFGIASAGVVPNQTGNVTINVRSGAMTTGFGGYARSQPTIKDGGIVDDASFQTPIAPGSYVAIFGTSLVDPGYSASATTPTLPLTINGVSVSFDAKGISVPARMVYAGSTQTNVQVPWELQGQTSVQVKVIMDQYSFSNLITVPVADVAPGIFDIGGGIAAARDAITGALVYDKAPAKAGQIVALYANGLGPVTNQPASGDPAQGGANLSQTKSPPTVTIGGKQAQVGFSGLAPSFAGLYQVNVTVPDGLAAGNQPVILTIAGKTAKTINLPVQ
jgi:uncharacterized protein (TIGR03437 family)